MLKDALQFLSEQSQSAGTKIIGFDPHKCHVLIKPDGNHSVIEAQPDHRNHVARTFSTLGEFVERWGDSESASVWCDFDNVIMFPDDITRRDKVSVPLPATAAWKWVTSLNESSAFSQRDLWLKLRTTIRSDASVDLAKRIAGINWQVLDEGESAVDRGKASIGKKLAAKVGGLEAVPETVELPIWTHKCQAFMHQATMTFFIDPNEETKTIRFFPLDGEVQMAMLRAMAAIRNDVQTVAVKNMVPIYCGTP